MQPSWSRWNRSSILARADIRPDAQRVQQATHRRARPTTQERQAFSQPVRFDLSLTGAATVDVNVGARADQRKVIVLVEDEDRGGGGPQQRLLNPPLRSPIGRE